MSRDAGICRFCPRVSLCCNLRDLNHMKAKWAGYTFSEARVVPRNESGHSCFATARTVCSKLPNRSHTALWNERDAACI